MNKKEVGKVIEDRLEIRCSKCGRSQNYVRLKDKTIVCRKCGNIDPMEDK